MGWYFLAESLKNCYLLMEFKSCATTLSLSTYLFTLATFWFYVLYSPRLLSVYPSYLLRVCSESCSPITWHSLKLHMRGEIAYFGGKLPPGRCLAMAMSLTCCSHFDRGCLRLFGVNLLYSSVYIVIIVGESLYLKKMWIKSKLFFILFYDLVYP